MPVKPRSVRQFLWNAYAGLALGLFAPTVAHAADYVLVTGPDFPPYADQNLPDGGVVTRIVKQAYAKVGRTVDIQFVPWSRGFAAVRDGKADATFPYAPSAERLAIMQASEPIFMLQNRAWYARDQPIAWKTPEDLAGKRLCQPLGYAPSKPIQALIDRGALQLIQPRNMESCVRMVQSHRADFTTDDPTVIRAVMARTRIDLAESPQTLEHRPLVLLAAKGDSRGAAVLADFNEGLRRMKADGSYDRIIQGWPGLELK
jgi:polar amino acid transport system substrate-binding protein